jgi:streptogramin lyase
MRPLLRCALLAAALSAALLPARAAERFTEHGVAAPVAELRHLAVVVAQDGRRLVLANVTDMGPQGFLLVTDLATGETRQLFCPKDVPQSASFGALTTPDGAYYTGQGRFLLRLDVNTLEWRWHGAPSAGTHHWMSMAVDTAGVVWAGGHPTCALVSFDPAIGTVKDHGRMDVAEQYPSSIAADSAGWVYVGIGTARWNIVAYNPRTGERRQIIAEADRKTGSATVAKRADGKVLGIAGNTRYVLYDGGILPEATPVATVRGGLYYGEVRGTFPDGARVTEYSLTERRILVKEAGAPLREIRFDYRTHGAQVTSLGAGPGGAVYGSSAHPMFLFVLEPAHGALRSIGHVSRIGGGNFCAVAAQRGLLIGASYPDGGLWAFDPAHPFVSSADPKVPQNPRLLGAWKEDVCRPRTALAHPDGRHVIMAGFAAYGLCGGGIALADIETGAMALLTAERDLLPGHSCITLAALPDGNLIGGTSVEAPGGGHAVAREAEIFVLDWATRKVIFRAPPVPGQREIISLCVLPDGRAAGLTANATLFLFDPRTRGVAARASLAAHGTVPRHALHLGPGGTLYALLSKAVLRVSAATLDVEVLGLPPAPVTAGGALVGGRLYYASGARVWSFALDKTGR